MNLNTNMNKKQLKQGAKQLAKDAKLVTIDFPVEIAKRTMSSKYTMNKIFGNKKSK